MTCFGRILSAAFAGLALILVLQTSASAAKYTAKLAYVAQQTNPFHAGMEVFAKKVAEKTNGELEIKLFHSQQLGGDRDYVEGLQLGAIEMTGTSTAILSSFDKRMNLFTLPFLFRSSEHLDKILDGEIGRELTSQLPAKGIRVLAYLDLGARYMHNSRRMVRSPVDLRDLKIRVMENPIHLETYRALGARATPMARPEVYSALKQGVLDGLDNSLSFYESMGDYQVARYLTLGVPILQTPGVLAVSERFFQRLPPAIQKALSAAAIEAAPIQRKIFRDAEASILARLQSKGVVQEVIDPAPFQAATKSVWQKFADEVGGRNLVDKVVATR